MRSKKILEKMIISRTFFQWSLFYLSYHQHNSDKIYCNNQHLLNEQELLDFLIGRKSEIFSVKKIDNYITIIYIKIMF